MKKVNKNRTGMLIAVAITSRFTILKMSGTPYFYSNGKLEEAGRTSCNCEFLSQKIKKVKLKFVGVNLGGHDLA